MVDMNPQLREMMQNPEFVRQLTNPEMMQVTSHTSPTPTHLEEKEDDESVSNQLLFIVL